MYILDLKSDVLLFDEYFGFDGYEIERTRFKYCLLYLK